MSYTKTQWRNNQSPAINADNLNHIEQGVYDAHQDIAENTQNIESLTTQTGANTSAIALEKTERQQAVTAETLARESTDNNLQAQIDQLVAPSGTAPNPAEIENARIGADGVTYDTLGNAIRTQVTNLKSEINYLVDEYVSKNLFDTSGSTEGKYLNPSNGVPATNASWAYTDFIAVESSTNYILSYDNARIDNTQPYYFYCWYDSTQTYISGGTKSGTASAITSPSNARYIKISYEKDKAPYIQFEKGTTKTDYINYYDVTKIDPSRIDATNIGKTVIRIDDSYSLRSVFDSISPNEHNQYLIELEEGEYDTLNGFSDADKAKSGFIGLIVPNWTTLKGIGDKANVILYATLGTAHQNISALNMKGSASLFNLTVKGTKTRYAVHDDFGYSDDVCIRTVENCDFIARQCYYGAAYGSGVRSGAVWKFKDCIFDADTSNPFVLHSQNETFTTPADVTLENCTMKAKGLMGMRVGGMSSGVINRLHLIGCNLFGIYVAEEIANSGSGIDWKIDGYGNTPAMLQRFVATDGNQYYAEFSDEMQYFKAQVAISKYDVIYRVGAGCAVAMNNNKTPCGIALADASSGDLVPVKIRGSFDMTDYGLTLALGDSVKLSQGSFVVDNDAAQYIGICNNADQYLSMKLAGLMMI